MTRRLASLLLLVHAACGSDELPLEPRIELAPHSCPAAAPDVARTTALAGWWTAAQWSSDDAIEIAETMAVFTEPVGDGTVMVTLRGAIGAMPDDAIVSVADVRGWTATADDRPLATAGAVVRALATDGRIAGCGTAQVVGALAIGEVALEVEVAFVSATQAEVASLLGDPVSNCGASYIRPPDPDDWWEIDVPPDVVGYPCWHVGAECVQIQPGSGLPAEVGHCKTVFPSGSWWAECRCDTTDDDGADPEAQCEAECMLAFEQAIEDCVDYAEAAAELIECLGACQTP